MDTLVSLAGQFPLLGSVRDLHPLADIHASQTEIAERLSLFARTISTCFTVLKEYCIKRVGGYTYGHWEAK